MSEITAITPQKHDAARCNIEVDGRFLCGMKLETVMRHRLKAGSTVTEEELAAYQLESEQDEAFDKALLHITASMKTEREVRDFLKKKGYLEDVADEVVGRMKRYGCLDDAAYARAYAESMAQKKGSRLIALELKRKGVSEGDIDAAVSALGDEGACASRVLEKYLRGKDANDPKTAKKAYAHLLSKGFDYETARGALVAYLSEET